MSTPPTMRPDDRDAGTADIGRRMVSGTLWMVAMRWVIRLIGLANTAIIARVLTPEDFGVMAMAMVAVGLLVTITDGDIEMALVRSRSVDRGLSDTGWTLKIVAAVTTWAVLFFIAPLMSFYYGDDRLTAVIRIAALQPLILGFEHIGVVEFRRSLNFSAEFRYLVAQRLGTFFVGLAIIFTFRNYLALAWTQAASALITVLLSYRVAKGRPRLSWTHWRELWLFSRWQMLFNSARLVGERCDQFIIGWLAGFTTTGVYAVGFDLAMMPTREIMLPAGRALLPAYSRITDDAASLSETFRTVMGFAAIIACASGLGISCIADDAVFLVLGSQWSAAVPFVRWLGVFGALEGIWLMLDPYLIAARQERTLAIANFAFAALTVAIVLAVALLVGVGYIPAGRIALMAAVLLGVFARMTALQWISPAALASVFWRPALSGLSMVAAVHLLHFDAAPIRLLSLLWDIGIGAMAYTGTLFALWTLAGRPAGAEGILLDLISTRTGLFVRRDGVAE